VRTKRADHKSMLRCLRVKLGKKGLNRRLRPVLCGGGRIGSHTLPNHVIGTDGQHDIREGSSRSDPGALLDNF
jgi:hypothetical protein